MKKLLLAFAILGFVACGGDDPTPTGDSTNVNLGGGDSLPANTGGVDTTNLGGDTSAVGAGTDTTTQKP